MEYEVDAARIAFEEMYVGLLGANKRALLRNKQGAYLVDSIRSAWVNWQGGWFAAIKHIRSQTNQPEGRGKL